MVMLESVHALTPFQYDPRAGAAGKPAESMNAVSA
jgi:hypothetical protein